MATITIRYAVGMPAKLALPIPSKLRKFLTRRLRLNPVYISSYMLTLNLLAFITSDVFSVHSDTVCSVQDAMVRLESCAPFLSDSGMIHSQTLLCPLVLLFCRSLRLQLRPLRRQT